MGSAEECRSPSSKVSPATLHHYAATHVFGSASVLLPKRLSYALGISLQASAPNLCKCWALQTNCV